VIVAEREERTDAQGPKCGWVLGDPATNEATRFATCTQDENFFHANAAEFFAEYVRLLAFWTVRRQSIQHELVVVL
jgi:hypothetical protein